MTDKEKDNRVNALAMTFLEELQITPHPFADQILRAYKAGYHQSEKDSLPKELVSEDFEVALENKVREAQDWTYIEEEGGECPLNEEFGADDLEEFARWGANLQKEQMIANAVDVTVHIDNGNYPYIPQMELYDYDKDIPLAKEGDKYKVILIKEE